MASERNAERFSESKKKNEKRVLTELEYLIIQNVKKVSSVR